MQTTIEGFWEEYHRGRSIAARNRVAEHYLPLVRLRAKMLRKRLPNLVDLDDLESWGFFGLLDAIESFEPEKQVKFETYSSHRITGAMLDALRNFDWVPRTIRARQRKIDAAVERVEAGVATQQENELAGSRFTVPAFGSLSSKVFETETGRDIDRGSLLEDFAPAPEFSMLQAEDWNRTLSGFTRAEQLIIRLYHIAGLTMQETGRAIGFSESRVSQVYSNLLLRLRAKLEPEDKDERNRNILTWVCRRNRAGTCCFVAPLSPGCFGWAGRQRMRRTLTGSIEMKIQKQTIRTAHQTATLAILIVVLAGLAGCQTSLAFKTGAVAAIPPIAARATVYAGGDTAKRNAVSALRASVTPPDAITRAKIEAAWLPVELWYRAGAAAEPDASRRTVSTGFADELNKLIAAEKSRPFSR